MLDIVYVIISFKYTCNNNNNNNNNGNGIVDNVDKRIQEDNLQHLALFSEYGRMALDKPDAYSSSNSSTSDNDADGIKSATEAALLCASVVASNVS